ncbi:uncharacterized protein LOC134186742 isoform X2 [Corticium candelabrum]|uniref:uncharacterized protein LOC134186742 isoform X2 n=1 Tax=Corticium candelabrum TaxID=121492 RepID=UPI002E2658E9|nr:uncharacterized protein LOC134186742 isoform X2 [Corticium candelabrum]XP_062510763.1 uncharacterized protein LOC134186742 isoform X2 [Corticium candelabrum]
MKKAPKGSGCGPSGWRVCSIIAAGLVPEPITKLLCAARLIALSKSSGDVRPIAIGEVFRRITAKTICSQYKDSFSKFFAPLQHGIATDGGADLLVHHVQLLLDSHKDWVVMKTDAKNAFNAVKRSHLLTQVSKHFPEMFPMSTKCTQALVPLSTCKETALSYCLLKKAYIKGILWVQFCLLLQFRNC